MYHIDIMTLFPDVVGDMLCESILGRGQERGYIRIDCHQIRDYTKNKQKQVDDYPYGGGRGAVMQADPLYQCWKHICDEAGERIHTIYMSPAGRTFRQADARRLKDDYQRIILVCGHYEGIDQRFIDECVDEEISIGDFVMTGGEIPAMAVADAVCRLVPGVLSDPSCYENESHWNGMLEAPQYSRPEVWHDRTVPPILLSGNHAKVEQWRRKQSILRTRERRPDLYEKLDLSSKEDRKLLKELDEEELVGMLVENSDEPYAKEIARRVMRELRNGNAVDTTTRLRELIEEALVFLPVADRKEAVKKSCQRCFQALRIDINSEFEVLYSFLDKLPGALKPGGRAAILTFHSGEDRLVKRAFKDGKKAGLYSEISADVIRPSAEECIKNGRARSTKLRWAIRG